MAGRAITGSQGALSTGMVHGCRHKIRGVLMAGIALRGSRDMAGRLRLHARRHAMASIATASDRWVSGGVIEDRAFEGGG